MSDLSSILNSIGHPRILVVGDLILDRYTWGDAERVSPEAPVLVLRVDSKEIRLGGAASVAMLLRGLEAEVDVAGVIGEDSEGRALQSLLRDEQIDASLILSDPGRPTTTKDRFLGRGAGRSAGGGQQILRVDHEWRAAISDSLEEQLVCGVLERLSEFQAVLISDYAKGVCSQALLRRLIDAAQTRGVPVLVDPARITDYSRYRGVTLLKPNRIEAELASGTRIGSAEDALAFGRRLGREQELNAVVITLDSDGMALVQSDGSTDLIPAGRREIYDITGAGDMALAALGLSIAAGVPLPQAVRLANLASGLQVEKLGVAPVSRDELLREIENQHGGQRGQWRRIPQPSKITTVPELVHLAQAYRQSGKTIVFTNGCFDLLHVGHVTMLKEAAVLGDVLIVAVNSDASVRLLKGPDRPIINEHDRAEMLASLACVDHVLIFEEPTPHGLLELIRPDILAKGGTTLEIIGREVVEGYGGRVIQLPEIPGASTTAIVSRFGRDPAARGNVPIFAPAVPDTGSECEERVLKNT